MTTSEEVAVIEKLIGKIKETPELINESSLASLRKFIESYGGKIPVVTAKSEPQEIPPELLSEDSAESDVEFANVTIFPKEDLPFPEQGDSLKEVSEDEINQSNELRSQGVSKLGEGSLDECLELLTKAICLNPKLAVNYAKRADCLLRMKRFSAAIADCNNAIKINPDSALAYKIRGKSNKMLGNWEDSFRDFQTSNKIDFSEDVQEAIKEIYEHNQKYEHIRRENRVRRAKRAHLKNSSSQAASSAKPNPTANPFGGGCQGGNPLGSLFSDPELMSAMQDPEVMAAIPEIMQNPGNFMKYQNNPKFQKLFSKLQKTAGGMPGMANDAKNIFNNQKFSSDDLD